MKISLLTMGQGDEVWELFGHNAIWVHDATAGTDTVWNWGIFDASEPLFVPRFLKGHMTYTMAGNTIDEILGHYRYYNRPVWIQELNLTAAEKLKIRDFIRTNSQPENRPYVYDYFLDNCSTRTRDVIDQALGGEIARQLAARPSTETYRSHALRMLQSSFLFTVGVDIGLGRPTDVPITEKEESFLPTELQQSLRTVTLDGGSRKLVASERLILPADRPAEPTAPPPVTRWLLAPGLFVALLIAAAGLTRARWARLVSAYAIGVWSIVAGVLGTVLWLLWMITNHQAAHQNENVLLLHPIWFGGVALALAVGRQRVSRTARFVAVASLVMGLVALAMHLVGLSRQDNWAILALTLPIALATFEVERRTRMDASTALPRRA